MSYDSPIRRFLQRKKDHGPFVSPYLLDLKQNQGGLERVFIDVPAQKRHQTHYLRRQERWPIPPSYRTGMAFFVTIMTVFSLGLTAVGAYQDGEQRQQLIGAQILYGLEEITENWNDSSLQTSNVSPFLENTTAAPVLLADREPNAQQELLTWNIHIKNGFDAFDSFVEQWNNHENSIAATLQNMLNFSGKALNSWAKVLERTQVVSLKIFKNDQQGPLQEAVLLVRRLSEFLSTYQKSYESLGVALGANEPQRMLVFIQDDAELRPGGGALSAGVEILIDNGEILAWRPFHVDDFESLLRADLQPPRGFESLHDRWDLSIANAYEDSSLTAEQILWFWQRQARSSADLVAFVSLSALEQLFSSPTIKDTLPEEKIALIENLDLKWSLARANNDRNYLTSTSSELIDHIAKVIQNPQQTIDSWYIVQNLLREKQLTFYSKNQQTQAQLRLAGVSGELELNNTDEDFLMVSNFNQDNSPTDRWIEDQATLHTSLKPDGSIVHWLKLNRRNLWNSAVTPALSEELGFPLNSTSLNQLGAGQNTSTIRILVPKGTTLEQIDGINETEVKIQELSDFSMISFNWTTTPGETKELAFTYQIPQKFNIETVDNYRLTVFKQMHKKAMGFHHEIKLPKDTTLFQQLTLQPIEQLEQDTKITFVAGKNP